MRSYFVPGGSPGGSAGTPSSSLGHSTLQSRGGGMTGKSQKNYSLFAAEEAAAAASAALKVGFS